MKLITFAPDGSERVGYAEWVTVHDSMDGYVLEWKAPGGSGMMLLNQVGTVELQDEDNGNFA